MAEADLGPPGSPAEDRGPDPDLDPRSAPESSLDLARYACGTARYSMVNLAFTGLPAAV
jgi:hypothetical protein